MDNCLKPVALLDPATEEMRCASRFRLEPKTVFAMLRVPDGQDHRVEVHDESLFGICLAMAETYGLTVGSEVDLSYFAIPLHGTVRHITPAADGVFLIGLSTSASMAANETSTAPTGR